jgi:hypothetical protein
MSETSWRVEGYVLPLLDIQSVARSFVEAVLNEMAAETNGQISPSPKMATREANQQLRRGCLSCFYKKSRGFMRLAMTNGGL